MLAVQHLNNLRSPNARSVESRDSQYSRRRQTGSLRRSRLDRCGSTKRIQSGSGSAKAAYKDLIGMYQLTEADMIKH